MASPPTFVKLPETPRSDEPDETPIELSPVDYVNNNVPLKWSLDYYDVGVRQVVNTYKRLQELPTRRQAKNAIRRKLTQYQAENDGKLPTPRLAYSLWCQ